MPAWPLTTRDIDPVAHDRAAWDKQVEGGNEWTLPVGADVIARARAGDWSAVLIGYEPVARDFDDERFDLVFNPVSNLFCPELAPVWRECYRVIRPGGALLAGFMNPDIFIFSRDGEDERGELIVRHSLP